MKTLKEINSFKKRVLVRFDLNVPMKDNSIIDSTRIEATIPTLRFLLQQQAKIIILTHLGRPQGKRNPKLSCVPIAQKLGDLLAARVIHLEDLSQEAIKQEVRNMHPKDILMLENLRFYPEEEKNDEDFARFLAELGDIYINDAFGTSHRAHASIVGVAKHLPSACGLLMEKELHYLKYLLKNPQRPFMALIGGSKVSDKILLLDALFEKVDKVVIGGAMSYTFLKALGKDIGASIFEQSMTDLAKALLHKAQQNNIECILPCDHIVTDTLLEGNITLANNDIPKGFFGADIGPQSIQKIQNSLQDCKTIFWNGPLGITEIHPFETGTRSVAQSLSKLDATIIIGGGNLVSALKNTGIEKHVSHISTGGGACIQFLEKHTLIGIEALEHGERS